MKGKKMGPTVRHTTISPDKDQLESMILKFIPAVVTCAHKKREADGWVAFKDERNLLTLRKDLLKLVRCGMLERKDLEEEIALLACVIWFLRKQNRKSLMDTMVGDFV